MTWWRDAVVYQIYPRSFADGSDGLGDLAGIRSRLDYLVELGIDAIWMSPFYPSPMSDGGYDVAGYCDVDPRFGTLEDFDALVAAAAERSIRLIVDIVPNHCSVEHPRFRAALEAGPGSPERELFIFREGRGPDGAEPPNNWQSRFGGPAWTRVADGQWYLHLFDSSQPDWDWTNPDVPAFFEKVIRFWLDRGVGGLRIDAASTIYKEAGLPDLDEPRVFGTPDATNLRPELPDLFRTWRPILDSYPADRFPGPRTGVLETWALPEHLKPYFERSDGLPQMFNFLLLLAPWEPARLWQMIETSRELTDGSQVSFPWVLENHDVTRKVSHYGWSKQELLRFPPNGDDVDLALGTRRARAAALLYLALPGSAYVYQGQELGLPEVFDIPVERRDDPTFFRRKGATTSRDGCRVPLPWSGTESPFGFSSGEPWLPQPADWSSLTVEAQLADPESTLSLYRAAIRQRPTGAMRWVDGDDHVFHFTRGDGFACLVNFGDEPVVLPGHHEVLLSSGPLVDGQLPTDTAVWLRL